MNASYLFRSTLPFCYSKLILSSIDALINLLLLVICLAIGRLYNFGGVIISLMIWFSIAFMIHKVIMQYFGYLIKAGHIAVLTETAMTGRIPPNQLSYGKQKVMERFVTASSFAMVDALISASIKQIQRGIQRLTGFLDFIPGMNQVAALIQYFLELSLGYIDECCLGYTFYRSDQRIFQSACDGVVIYAQNIKALLKNAAKTMGYVLAVMIVFTLLIFVLMALLFRALHWNLLIAAILSWLIAWVLKYAFIDSYILCRTMISYMSLAASTPIQYDLVGKLCSISSKFKQLWSQGHQESDSNYA